MARKKVKAWREEEPPRRTAWSRIRSAYRLARTLVVIGAILYGAALVASRTDGFRDLVAARLERHLGMPVKVESVAANARFDLTLQGIVTEGTRHKNSPGLRAHRVTLAWSWRDVLRRGGPGLRLLDLDRCVITFARDEQGVWQPADMAPLSEFLAKWLQLDLGTKPPENVTGPTGGEAEPREDGAPAAGKPTVAATGVSTARALRDARLSIVLRRSEVTWWGDGDVPLAAVEGVNLAATPVRLPNRTMTHYHLKLDHAAGAQGLSVSDMTLELLDTGDQQLVLVFDAGRTSGLMKR